MSTLKFAFDMEKDGQHYYEKQAKANAGSSIGKVFSCLAKAESQHARLIADYGEGKNLDFSAEDLRSVNNVFSDLSGYRTDVTSIPKQLDVYRFALDLEQKSINLYQKLLKESEQEEEKKLLDFLIEQEEEHFTLFEELVAQLSKPEEWVEDAEFGKREEY